MNTNLLKTENIIPLYTNNKSKYNKKLQIGDVIRLVNNDIYIVSNIDTIVCSGYGENFVSPQKRYSIVEMYDQSIKSYLFDDDIKNIYVIGKAILEWVIDDILI